MIRIRVAVLALAVVVTLASCSGERAPRASPPAAPSPSPTSPVSSEALIEAGLTDPAPTVGLNQDLGVIACPTTATDRYGTYVPTCVRDDATVLQFDPAGGYSWLVADPRLLPLDPSKIATTVNQAGHLMVQMIDSTAQWDDSPTAWAGIRSTFDDVLGPGSGDLRANVASSLSPNGLFDVGDWREAAGLRPAPYPSDVPRIRVLSLEVEGMAERSGEPMTPDNVGVSVEVRATFTQPVLTADGTEWELKQWATLTVSSLNSTGAVDELEWSEDHVIGRNLTAGERSLPRFDTTPAVPVGWTPQTIGTLTFALPARSRMVEQSDPGIAGTPWKQFSLGASEAVLDVSGPTPMIDPSPEGRWYVVPGFDNYGLAVPGAEIAAAEVGRDEQGRFRVRVALRTTEATLPVSYHVEWDTTPDRATDELRKFVGTMSFAAGAGTRAQTCRCRTRVNARVHDPGPDDAPRARRVM